jgi:hypothetical protein
VKLDNLVHIGHNCDIGEDVVIASQTGISGLRRWARGDSGRAGGDWGPCACGRWGDSGRAGWGAFREDAGDAWDGALGDAGEAAAGVFEGAGYAGAVAAEDFIADLMPLVALRVSITSFD